MSNRFTSVLLAGAAVFAMAGAAHAEDAAFQPKAAGTIMLNVRLTDVAPDAGNAIKTAAGADTGLKAEVSNSVVPTIGLTYFFTDNVAAELILGTSTHEIKAVGGATNVKVHDTWLLPPVLSLQYHFAPKAKFSPYVGAGVNYMIFYSGSDKNGFTVKPKDGFGTALQAGFDYNLSGKWSLNVDVKKVFFNTKANINAGALNSSVDLDPLVASVGVGYKF
jgi:outer membrane protein